MTLRDKGTRRITVDSCTYRWVVAPDDEPGLGIVVEQFENPRQRMVTWVDHGTVVSPGLVERTIRLALMNGWDPMSPGRELHFRLGGNQLDRGITE